MLRVGAHKFRLRKSFNLDILFLKIVKHVCEDIYVTFQLRALILSAN